VSGPASIHLFLDPDTGAPRRARRALRSELESVLEAEVLDQAVLLVSELVTNSVRHGGLRPDQEIELTVRAFPHRLRVEVVEPGEGFEVDSTPLPRRGIPAGGWGLYLVDRLSSAWGVEGGDVTRVWFELDKLSS
jgi:anti-sigma regulatory factor (Ser/Thr protein kinase)